MLHGLARLDRGQHDALVAGAESVAGRPVRARGLARARRAGRDLLVDRALSRACGASRACRTSGTSSKAGRARRARDRDHAVPLQPPRDRAAHGAGRVSAGARGAARRAAPAVPLLEGQPPRFHRARAEPARAGARRGQGGRGAGARPAPRQPLRAGRFPRRRRATARLRACTACRCSARSTSCRSSRARPRPRCSSSRCRRRTRRRCAARSICARAADLPFRTVPRLEDVVAGRSSFNELKEVAIEDLLGREPVQLDWTAIRTQLAGKRVLVTGGGGSIGSELCRQIARLGAESLTVLEHVRIQPLHHRAGIARATIRICCSMRVLGDCGDAVACERVFAPARPEVVFHAAAYKHVPLLQGAVARGVPQQRARHRDRRRGRRSPRRRQLRADLDRQGGQSDQRDGRLQARRRNVLPELRAPVAHALHHGALRQRARFGRLGRAAVPRADPRRRPGHGHASGDHALFHDDPGSLPADPAGGRARQRRRDLRARHGRAGAHPRSRRADDPPRRQDAGRRHPDRLHRPAPRRETVRGTVPSARELQRHDAREDFPGAAAQHVVEPADRAAATGRAAPCASSTRTRCARVLEQPAAGIRRAANAAQPHECHRRSVRGQPEGDDRMQQAFAQGRVSRSPASARASCRRPRSSPRKCCRCSTGR